MIPFVFHIILFLLFWMISTKIKRYDLVDVLWGLSFVSLCISTMLYENFDMNERACLLVSLIFVWGVRLAAFLFVRFAEKDEMDKRYQEMIAGWTGSIVLKSLTHIFLLQALVSFIIAYPLISSIVNTSSQLNLLDLVGGILWLIGFTIESISDYQKLKFKRKEPYGVCRVGLWKFSRHPNYFGEILLWYGIGLIMISQINALLAMLTPIFTHLIIYFVSGVALLEQKYKNDPKYETYIKETNPLLFKLSLKDNI